MEARDRDRIRVEAKFFLDLILTKENLNGLEKIATIGKVSPRDALNKIVESKLKEYVEKGIFEKSGPT